MTISVASATREDLGPRQVPWSAVMGLALVVLVSPLFASMHFSDPFLLPRFLPLALGGVLLWWSQLRAAEVDAAPRKLTIGVRCFWAAMLLSTIGSIDLPLSVLGPHQGELNSVVPLALVTLLGYGASYLDIKLDQVTGAAVIGGVLVAGVAALEMIGVELPFLATSVVSGRASATFGSPIFLGAYLALLVPLAWQGARAGSLLGQLGLAVIGLGLWASGSRGPVAAAIGGVVAYELLVRGKRGWTLSWLAAVQLLFLVMPKRTASDLGRWEVWRAALEGFRQHPWLGSGPDTFGLVFRRFMTTEFIRVNESPYFVQLSAHHDILQVAATMGAVGLIAYGVLLARTWVVATGSRDATRCAAAGALIALFLNAKVNPIHIVPLALAAVIVGILDRPEAA